MLCGITIEPTGPLEPTEEDLHRQPWKYTGYKGFTSFLSSDQDFFALRRFGRLHTRVLVSIQAQLQSLETQLDKLDERCASKTIKLGAEGLVEVTDANGGFARTDLRDVNNGTVQDDLPVRKKLITDIQSKLVEYDDVLTRYCSVRGLFPAPKRNIRNIEAWLENNHGAIMADEADFISHHDDLMSVSKPKAILRQWFEEKVVYRSHDGLKLFHRPPKRHTLSARDQKETYIVGEDAIEAFGSVAVFAAATTMLIVPLWLLQMLKSMRLRLAVITVFVFLFVAFISCGTLGRPFERLAATAGYAAVLVVFLQTGS